MDEPMYIHVHVYVHSPSIDIASKEWVFYFSRQFSQAGLINNSIFIQKDRLDAT